MGLLAKLLKGQDKFAVDTKSSSTVGGLVTIFTYVAALVYLVIYILGWQGKNFPSTTTVKVFPGQKSGEEMYFPPMKCMAETGCYYVPFNMQMGEETKRRILNNPAPAPGGNPAPTPGGNQGGQGGNQGGQGGNQGGQGGNQGGNQGGQGGNQGGQGGNQGGQGGNQGGQPSGRPDVSDSGEGQAGGRKCYYAKQGESLPKAHRRVFYSSDPIDVFTVIWKGGNFGLSYNVDTVTKMQSSLQYSTVEAVSELGTEASGAAFKLFRGQSLMALVHYDGLGGDTDKVQTWTNTVTSEDGTPDSQNNLCCAGKVYNLEGTEITSDLDSDACEQSSSNSNQGGNSANSNTYYQTRIQPFPTYTSIEVSNPYDVLEVWGLIGGALAVIDLVAGFVLAGLESLGFAGSDEVDPAEEKEDKKQPRESIKV